MPSRCRLIFTEAYDPLDRWIKEETTQWGFTNATWFAYDGGQIALRFDGNGSLTGRYLHGEAVDQIFAEEVGGQTRWTLTNTVTTGAAEGASFKGGFGPSGREHCSS